MTEDDADKEATEEVENEPEHALQGNVFYPNFYCNLAVI